MKSVFPLLAATLLLTTSASIGSTQSSPTLTESGMYSLEQNQGQIQIKNPSNTEQRVVIFSDIPFIVARMNQTHYENWSIETESISFWMKPNESVIIKFIQIRQNKLIISFSN